MALLKSNCNKKQGGNYKNSGEYFYNKRGSKNIRYAFHLKTFG